MNALERQLYREAKAARRQSRVHWLTETLILLCVFLSGYVLILTAAVYQ